MVKCDLIPTKGGILLNKLERQFFDRDTLEVARDLLGKYLVRMWQGQALVGRITETEAYIGRCDKACHAYGYKRTARTETLFAPPGTAYIYLIYGMYHCLNFVTEAEGEPAAVLLRGLEPVEGLVPMSLNRFGKTPGELTSYQKKHFLDGPGKVCRALALTRAQNGLDLCGEEFFLCDSGEEPPAFHTGPRVGIDYAQEAVHFPWRFYI